MRRAARFTFNETHFLSPVIQNFVSVRLTLSRELNHCAAGRQHDHLVRPARGALALADLVKEGPVSPLGLLLAEIATDGVPGLTRQRLLVRRR